MMLYAIMYVTNHNSIKYLILSWLYYLISEFKWFKNMFHQLSIASTIQWFFIVITVFNVTLFIGCLGMIIFPLFLTFWLPIPWFIVNTTIWFGIAQIYQYLHRKIISKDFTSFHFVSIVFVMLCLEVSCYITIRSVV